MRTKTEYETSAEAFLQKWNITFSATRANDGKCPPFCDGKHIHGQHWRVRLARENVGAFTFSFWDSLNDFQSDVELSAYSVLACCSSDIHCPDTFEEFCAEYGYDEDSRKAEKTFQLCQKQSEGLNTIFNSEEVVADLETIN